MLYRVRSTDHAPIIEIRLLGPLFLISFFGVWYPNLVCGIRLLLQEGGPEGVCSPTYFPFLHTQPLYTVTSVPEKSG